MAPSSFSLSTMSIQLTIALLFLLPSAFSSSLRLASSLRPQHYGFRLGLTHIDAGKNYTSMERLQRALHRARHRVERLSPAKEKTTAVDEIQASVQGGNGEYFINLSVGTPPISFMGIMDTGSDLIWAQCKPCANCFNNTAPIFDPKQSSTFANISCNSELCNALSSHRCGNGCEYMYSYGDSSSSQGFLASETFTFGGGTGQPVSVPNIGFGCGVNNQGTGFDNGSGIVGLGRGPLSLVAQLGLKKFSYCLTSFNGNKTSSLLFGSEADLNYTNDPSKRTPLIKNPNQSSFYYLSLEGITVGETRLPIPKSVFELRQDGGGGMILDSGTTVTMLTEDAYNVLKTEFVTQSKLKVSTADYNGLDACFELPSKNVDEIEVPKMKFHFQGLDLELPSENYMIADPNAGLICLAMAAAGGLSIFGNIQQQNMLVLHDMEQETLSFFPTQCDRV